MVALPQLAFGPAFTKANAEWMSPPRGPAKPTVALLRFGP